MKLCKLFSKIRIGKSGLSLIELVCAIGILSVIGASVCGVMVVGSRSYKNGMKEADIQESAQVIVNHIDDLLIDSVEDVTFSSDVLTMKSNTKEYQIEFDSTAKTLTYYENRGEADEKSEVFATGVESFNVDPSTYVKNGNVKLSIGMVVEGSDRTYASDFNITSRNGKVDTSTFAGGSASLTVPSTFIIEPNLSYNMKDFITVSGSACDLVFNIVDTDVDTNTKVIDSYLYCGNNEMKDSFIVRVRALKKNTSVEYDSKEITVKVRRVNGIEDIAFDAKAEYKSGDSGTFTSDLSGTNLLQEVGNPTDPADGTLKYVDPQQIEWKIVASESTDASLVTLYPSNKTCGYRINRDFAMGDYVTVRAIAKHPAGDNKVGAPYDTDIMKEVKLTNLLYIPGGDGNMYRATDKNQATIVLKTFGDAVYSCWKDSSRPGHLTDINQLDNSGQNVYREFRFRESPTGTWTHGDGINTPWIEITEWGDAVRITEDYWAFDPDKSYDVEIRLFCKSSDKTKRYYPDKFPASAYTVSAHINKAKIAYTWADASDTTKVVVNDSYGLGSKTSPVELNVNKQYVVTANTDYNIEPICGLRFARFNDYNPWEIYYLNTSTGTFNEVYNGYDSPGSSTTQLYLECNAWNQMPEISSSHYITFKKTGLYMIKPVIRGYGGKGLKVSDISKAAMAKLDINTAIHYDTTSVFYMASARGNAVCEGDGVFFFKVK